MAKAKQLLRDALSRFTRDLLRDAKAETGWTHEKLWSELFRQHGAVRHDGDIKPERGVYDVEFGTYLQYLLPATNPKSRVPRAGNIQALENRVAELIGRPAQRVAIWNYQTTSGLCADLSPDGPADNFRNFGTPGALKVRSVPSMYLRIDYAWDEQRYLGELCALAAMWPSLARAWQLVPNDAAFDRHAARAWLLKWQQKIQRVRRKVAESAWREYWKRLPKDFQDISLAPAGSLPTIPEIWPTSLLERVSEIEQFLYDGSTSAGILPEIARKSAHFTATASNVTH